jgi:glutamate-1-semialdehyde 2,1-aminomutase
LIFDEVVTNFRLALGGAVEYYGIRPDLHCLGKILGGGYAIGGFGGRKDIMDQVVTPRSGFLDLSEQIFQSGCFSGNPISMTAGYTVLDLLDKDKDQIYPRLEGLASSLAGGLREIGQRKGLPILVNQVASIIQVHFSESSIRNKRDALKVDKKLANQFHLGLRAGGVMASYHPLFLSTAHTQAHIDRVLEVAEEVLTQMAVAAPAV